MARASLSRALGAVTAGIAVLAAACAGGAMHPASSACAGALIKPIAASGRVDPHASSWVTFTIGLSTDPYGNSNPGGFGVATGMLAGPLRIARVRNRQLAANQWLAPRRLLIWRPYSGGTALIFGLPGGRLECRAVTGINGLGGGAVAAFSPDGKVLAVEPAVRVSCGPDVTRAVARAGCATTGATVYVDRANGSGRHPVARGLLSGWTPDGRLLLFTGKGAQFSPGRYLALDLRSRRETNVLSSAALAAYAHARGAQLGELAYSADGRYLAALAWLPGNQGVGIRAIALAKANGSIVRLITSTDIISMFAWSPHGHELAYTTSGFSTPHELYVLTSPTAPRWRILSQVEHFDWVTWSPDGRYLLIDNEHLGEWELLHLVGHRQAGLLDGASVPTRRLPRLGGQPLWCCPQQHYGGSYPGPDHG
jgi:hypothetical protein